MHHYYRECPNLNSDVYGMRARAFLFSYSTSHTSTILPVFDLGCRSLVVGTASRRPRDGCAVWRRAAVLRFFYGDRGLRRTWFRLPVTVLIVERQPPRVERKHAVCYSKRAVLKVIHCAIGVDKICIYKRIHKIIHIFGRAGRRRSTAVRAGISGDV